MNLRSRLEAAPGERRRAWKAPNGQTVVLPLLVTAWEPHPLTGEYLWKVTARVDLVDRKPQTVEVLVSTPDGLDTALLQRDFRWATPADVVTQWAPTLLAEGRDPFTEEPPRDGWSAFERQELTDEFLRQIGAEYLELGRGYTSALAAKYGTTPRTVRSWVEKARERGLLGAAPKRGKTGVIEP
jgi:hypothetical protein